MRLLWLTVVLLPLAAHAQPRTLHNVPWYRAHEAGRRATVQLCESDARFANLPDCNNAEMAAAGAMFEHRRSYESLSAELHDPHYWAANPIARAGNWRECQEGVGMALPYCDAIRASFAIKP